MQDDIGQCQSNEEEGKRGTHLCLAESVLYDYFTYIHKERNVVYRYNCTGCNCVVPIITIDQLQPNPSTLTYHSKYEK